MHEMAIREGWKRRKQIPIENYKDGSQAMEASIFRKGLAILTPKCFLFFHFLEYVLKILAGDNHVICKNVQ